MGFRRLLSLSVAAVVACLALAAPAHAEDMFDLDLRLNEAGLADAWTNSYGGNDDAGYRLFVEYSSQAADEQEYLSEAELAAELIWDHLDGKVGSIDVTPSNAAAWLDGDLPATVSYSRADLRQEFGPRPSSVRDTGDPYDSGDEVFFGVFLLVVGVVALAGVVGVVVLIVWLCRDKKPAGPTYPYGPYTGTGPYAGPYAGPSAQPYAAGQGGPYVSPQVAPHTPQTAPVDQANPFAPGFDPFASPAGDRFGTPQTPGTFGSSGNGTTGEAGGGEGVNLWRSPDR